MKTASRLIAAIAALFWVSVAAAAEKTVTLTVENMTCPTCAPVVKKSLMRVEGITKVEVSRENHSATVTFDEAKTDVAALITATTNAGYPSRLAK